MLYPDGERRQRRLLPTLSRPFDTLGAAACVLTLWEDTAASVERLADADLVYVGGGSTLNLLALWRVHGVDEVLTELAGREGTVLAGISAGANCWYEGSSTDSFGPELRPLPDGLGLLPGSFCPHFDGQPGRRESF
nr:Type 1 glutamine amidotransferase-like domain-containing protein [Bowdeniella nasicola]